MITAAQLAQRLTELSDRLELLLDDPSIDHRETTRETSLYVGWLAGEIGGAP